MATVEVMAAGVSAPSNRRESTRKRVEGSLSLVDLGAENGGLMLDLSEGGLALQTVFPVSPEPAIPVRFELPESGVSIHATAEVAWMKNSKQVGLRFTQIPDDARQQIRQWLTGEVQFNDAFTPSLDPSALVYSDLPDAEPAPIAEFEQVAAEKTIRHVPQFAKQPAPALKPELIPAQQTLTNVVPTVRVTTFDELTAQKTIRYIPKFVAQPAPEPPKDTLPYPLLSAEEIAALPEVQPLEDPTPAEVSMDEVSALLGRQLTAQLAEPLAMVWRSPRFLNRLRSLPASGRRHMLQELEFQARAMSLWLLEINCGGVPVTSAPESQPKRDPSNRFLN